MAYFRQHYHLLMAFPRSIKLFYISDIFFAFSQALWYTLFNLHLLEAGFTAGHVGLLQSASSLITALVAIPVGLAGDRWGPRRFYIFGSLLFGVPCMIVPWLRAFPALTAVFLLQVIMQAFMMVNEPALLAAEVDSDKRALVFSFLMMNFFLWNTLGVQLAGFLASWLPAGALSHYQWPLVISGAGGILSGVLRSLLPFRPSAPARRLNLRPSRTTLQVGLVSLLCGMFFVLTQNFNNVVLAERFHMDSRAISTVFTVVGILGWFGSLAVPWTSRRFGDLRAWAGVVGMQGLALIYLGFAAMPFWFLPGYAVRNLLTNMQNALFSAFTMNVTPEAERATANSFAMVGRNLGSAAVAGAYGAAIAAGNYPLPFGLAGVGAIGSALLALLFFGRRLESERTSVGAD